MSVSAKSSRKLFLSLSCYSTSDAAQVAAWRRGLLVASDIVTEGNSFGFRVRGGIDTNAVSPTCNENSTDEACGVRPLGSDAGLRSGGETFSDANWLGSIVVAHSSENFDFLAAYARREEGNYFAGENGPETFYVPDNSGVPLEQRFSFIEPGQEVPNTSKTNESVLLKGTARFGDGHSVHGGLYYYNSQFGMAFPTNLVTFQPSQTRLNDVESNRLWLRYNWQPENELINFNANIWRTQIQEQGEVRQAPQDNESWGAEVWNTSVIDTGFGELTMTYGAEYSRSEGAIDLDVPVVTVINPGQSPVFSGGTLPLFEGTREVFGGHFNTEFSPSD